MTESETSPQYLANYTKYFRKHLKYTRNHLYGSTRSSFVSSQVGPNGFWTSEEKERLFPALSRHSKLRPDLIALDVASDKTPVDVVAYIEVLERGLRDMAGVDLDSEDDVPLKHPPAHVVSEKWIEFEEQRSTLLARQEKEWDKETLELERKRVSKLLRKELRSAAVKNHGGNSSTRPDEKQLRTQWEAALGSLETQWTREDILEELTTPELVYMDKLIRRTEEASEKHRQRDMASTGTMELDEPNGMEGLDPTLTKANHKKLMKRLYMRRKRAEEAGVDYDRSEKRLKPGRKFKTSESTRQEHLAAESQDDEESQAKPSKPEKMSTRRGLNVPQRAEKRFDDAQINVDILRNDELDLFHHSKFASLWSILADEETPTGPVVESVSYTVLKLLRLLLERYLSKLIYMAISLAEAEWRSKRETVLWGGDYGSIRTRHVHAALDLMGVPTSHRTKAATLGREMGSDSTDEDGREGSVPLPDLSYPLIYHAQTLDTDNVLIDVISLEQHGEQLQQLEEFADDATREVLDAANDVRHELSLWRSMGFTNLTAEGIKKEEESLLSSEIDDEVEDWSDEVGDEPATNHPQSRRSLRFRPPGGDVKSQTFIFSEDEDEYDMDLL